MLKRSVTSLSPNGIISLHLKVQSLGTLSVVLSLISLVQTLKIMSAVQSVGSYRVLYAKAGVKKRKQFSDGFLHIKEGSGNSFMVTLTSEEGADLRKSSEKSISAFKVGEEAAFGGFVVQIEESMGSSKPASESLTRATVPAAIQSAINRTQPTSSFNSFRAPSSSFQAPALTNNRPVVLGAPAPTDARAPASAPSTVAAQSSSVAEIECDHDTFWDNVHTSTSSQPANRTCSTGMLKIGQQEFQQKEVPRIAPLKPIASSSSGLKRKVISYTVEQDPSLMKLMRPHQIVGADFLISRLLNNNSKKTANGDGDDEDGLGADADCTGAILADEVRVDLFMT